MKFISYISSFVLSTLALTVSATEKQTFIDQLDTEQCGRSPEKIYIDTNTQEFEMANAYSYSWLALQTLDVDPNSTEDDADADLQNAQENWGLSNVRMIDNARWNVRAMIADYDGAIFVTFRHTDSNLNWLLNADYGLWNFDYSFTMGEKVHHGFGTMLGAIWSDIVEEVRTRATDNQPVVVFGHSLGGAMALLTAPGLVNEGFNVKQVYATGSPKVGSRNWAAMASQALSESAVYRITNSEDLFARIPVSSLALDEFRELFFFASDFLANLTGRLRSQMDFGLIGDHIIVEHDGSTYYSDVETSEIEEQDYWINIAEQFSAIDDSTGSLIDKLNRKVQVMSNNLGEHLMRSPENGYTCSMINALKSGS
ncbi:lipase family protein [Pleionea sediminis]|uniref:lipase family protein n=1 Tax=Pleionea sediminis TaxID=2569479 RepID=UPI00118586A2|nr:lipase family protein [Pleionea sediminis]